VTGGKTGGVTRVVFARTLLALGSAAVVAVVGVFVATRYPTPIDIITS
jgi:hypothetical protein